MKKTLIYFTIIVGVAAIIGGCKSSDDGAATTVTSTTDTSTCTGTSSGSGPTIGSVALAEATYTSTCWSGRNIKMEFKNSTSAQFTTYTYGDNSCSGTATDETTTCMESITVSSTAVTKPTYVDGTAGDNATGYNVTAAWKHNTDTAYLQLSADNASVFWFNQSGNEAGRESNCCWLFKFTKQ